MYSHGGTVVSKATSVLFSVRKGTQPFIIDTQEADKVSGRRTVLISCLKRSETESGSADYKYYTDTQGAAQMDTRDSLHKVLSFQKGKYVLFR